MDLNLVAITGRLAADPRLHATGDGTDVTTLRVAVARARRNGEQSAEADFLDVVVWGEEGKQAARWLAKGCRIVMRGHLRQRTWTTPDGEQRSRTQVVADQLQFTDYKQRRGATSSPAAAGPNAEQPTREPRDDGAAATGATEAAGGKDAAQPPAEGTREPVTEVVVWTDGGSRGNPGPAGYGVLITTAAGDVLAELGEGIGSATNNAAEYRAVIAGLQRAGALGARRVQVRADAKLVIQQLNGTYKVNSPALVSLHAEALRLADGFDDVSFEHVAREANHRADALANQAMDAQGPVSNPIQETPEQAPEPATAPTSSVATGDGAPAK